MFGLGPTELIICFVALVVLVGVVVLVLFGNALIKSSAEKRIKEKDASKNTREMSDDELRVLNEQLRTMSKEERQELLKKVDWDEEEE